MRAALCRIGLSEGQVVGAALGSLAHELSETVRRGSASEKQVAADVRRLLSSRVKEGRGGVYASSFAR